MCLEAMCIASMFIEDAPFMSSGNETDITFETGRKIKKC